MVACETADYVGFHALWHEITTRVRRHGATMTDVRIEYEADREQTLPNVNEDETRLDAVRARAYGLFESRGKSEGSELDDWFQAESEVLGLSAHGLIEPDDQEAVAAALPTAVFAEPVALMPRNSVRAVHASKYAMNEGVTPLAAAKAGTAELRL